MTRSARISAGVGIVSISLLIASCIDSPMGWEKEDYSARGNYMVLGRASTGSTTIAPQRFTFVDGESLVVLLCGEPSDSRRNVILSRVFYADDSTATSARTETLSTALDVGTHVLRDSCPNKPALTYSTSFAIHSSKVPGISRLRVSLQGVKDVERELQVVHAKKPEAMPVATSLRVESRSFGLRASWLDTLTVNVQLLDSNGGTAKIKGHFVGFAATQGDRVVGRFYQPGEQAAAALRVATDASGAASVLFSAGDATPGAADVEIIGTATLSGGGVPASLSIAIE
jgi:hypothetical protein